MPGPVSDSYDPEWSTASNKEKIDKWLLHVYHKVSLVLDQQPPMYILNLVEAHLPKLIMDQLTEKEWRLIRFALERARESL